MEKVTNIKIILWLLGVSAVIIHALNPNLLTLNVYAVLLIIVLCWSAIGIIEAIEKHKED